VGHEGAQLRVEADEAWLWQHGCGASRCSADPGADDRDMDLLKYIELKSGYADNGPAWIARVKVSKSGRTIYFNGMALKRASGGGVSGNHYDLRTGQEYWVSGVKKDGSDRHWAGSGVIRIEARVVAEYLQAIGRPALEGGRFEVIGDLPDAEPSEFDALENRKLP
jgi:hypothetical protein